MRKETHIKSYTAADLKDKRMVSRTDLKKVDAMTDAELEKAITEDEDEQGLQPDWTRAELILSEPKQSGEATGTLFICPLAHANCLIQQLTD